MTYTSFADLAAAEVYGIDYDIQSTTVTGSSWCSIAIHGGGIERGSHEMAQRVADGCMSYYAFRGLKPSNNGSLHITSTLFDEPTALALVAANRRCLSFHGYVGTAGVPVTAIGGLDTVAVARVTAELEAAGFTVITAPSEIAGTNPANICNKTSTSAGVQLEMSRALRDSFMVGGASAAASAAGLFTDEFYRYAAAVRAAYIGYGVVSVGAVNASRWTILGGLTAADVSVSATVSTSVLATGGGHFAQLAARWQDVNNCYLARLDFNTSQGVVLTLRKRVAGTETFLVQHTTSLTHTALGRVAWRLEVSGTALRARAWDPAGAEPSTWQLSTTDSDLSAAGQVATRSILSSANTNSLPVVYRYGDFEARVPGRQTAILSARSVNGVSRAWDAGTPVQVWTPARAAL